VLLVTLNAPIVKALSMLITVAAPAVVPAPSTMRTSVVDAVLRVVPVPLANVFQLAAVLHVPPVAPTQ
jgi:hypothetical protein